ncbi:MAG: TRAP transporter small permease subunit [Pseudomonadota bacterium]
MSAVSEPATPAAALPPDGSTSAGSTIAQATRIFGWLNLAFLATYMANNFLVHGAGLPGAGAALALEGGVLAWLQLASYLAAIVLTVLFVQRTAATRGLRTDSATIHNANTFIIRAAFWAVFLVGIADATISFLRVEGLLESVVGEEMTTALGRPQYRGPVVHVPLMLLGVLIAMVTRTLGFIWLASLIVLAELLIVITRFVFSYEQAFMGDLVRFWYAALFLFASAYTLFEDGHVRVDVFYAGFNPRSKGFVNALGCILLGLALTWTIIFIGFAGRAAAINSPMMSFEVSQSGFGMYIKYLMAGFLGLFAITMTIQFVSYLMEAVADWRDEPGRREVAAEIAH